MIMINVNIYYAMTHYYICFVKSLIRVRMSRHTKMKEVIDRGMEEGDYDDDSEGDAELSKGMT